MMDTKVNSVLRNLFMAEGFLGFSLLYDDLFRFGIFLVSNIVFAAIAISLLNLDKRSKGQ